MKSIEDRRRVQRKNKRWGAERGIKKELNRITILLLLASHNEDSTESSTYLYKNQERKFSNQWHLFADKSRFKWISPTLRHEATASQTEQNVNSVSSDLVNESIINRTGSSEDAKTVLLDGSSNDSSGSITGDMPSFCYTTMKELSDSDRQQYEATEFQYIPFLPPPKELCSA
uniref:BZIP domain-containing protein n=1 Tax=Syphacia muris TaxID=451379 RepID=A0A0N5ABD3_9BILA